MPPSQNAVKAVATLPTLVTAVAEVDGRERPVVDNFARRLREAGLIRTGKRGVGAPDMDCRSAANLLIALAVAETAKDAHVEVARMRSLKAMPSAYTAESGLLHRIEECWNFGDALEELITGYHELLDIVSDQIRDTYRNEREATAWINAALNGVGPIWVRVEMSRYSARIYYEVHGLHANMIQWEIKFMQDSELLMEQFYGGGGADRQVISSFGLPTLRAVAGCLDTNEDGPVPSESDADAAA
jgi:hypothetical protein